MDEYNNNTKLNERMIQYWSIIHEYMNAFYNQYTNSKYNELLSSYKRSIYDYIIDIKNRMNHYIDTNHIHRRKVLLLQQIQDHTITKRLWHIRIVLVSTILFFVLYDILFIPTTTNHTYDMNTSSSSSTSTSNTKQQYLQSRISPKTNNKHIMDIISIGSLLKQQYQNAQQNTFAQNNDNNKNVRKYYRITERNDTDSTCYTTLTSDQLDSIIKFCHTKGKSSSTSNNNNNNNHDNIQKLLFHDLYHPKKHTGYICSQKRMIDGLYNILIQQMNYRTKFTDYYTQINYHHNLLSLPDYLLLIEDDTYIQNMNQLMNDLKQIYPSNVPYAIAGCVRTSNTDSINEPSGKASSSSSSILQYPHIGYGTILTKAAIERLLEPIYCNFDDSKSQQQPQRSTKATQHTILACWRLQQNHIGELEYFHDGMNIIELMYIYAKENLYTNIDPWKKKKNKNNQNNQNFNGYCLLSDTVLAYYINYYHITVSDNTLLQDQYNNQPNDYIRPLYSFVQLPTRTSNETTSESSSTTTISNNQCWLPQYDNTCTKEQHICHKIKPEQMYTLYNQSNTKEII